MLDGIATNGRSAEQRSHLEQARHDPMRWVGRDVVEPARISVFEKPMRIVAARYNFTTTCIPLADLVSADWEICTEDHPQCTVGARSAFSSRASSVYE